MKLFYSETLNPRKACAVAKYLGSPVEFVRVDLGKGEQRRPEFLAINPNGRVPALVDGDITLWEADAIMCHLARVAGSDPARNQCAGQIEMAPHHGPIEWASCPAIAAVEQDPVTAAPCKPSAVDADGRPDFAVNPFNGPAPTYDQAKALLCSSLHPRRGHVTSQSDNARRSSFPAIRSTRGRCLTALDTHSRRRS